MRLLTLAVSPHGKNAYKTVRGLYSFVPFARAGIDDEALARAIDRAERDAQEAADAHESAPYRCAIRFTSIRYSHWFLPTGYPAVRVTDSTGHHVLLSLDGEDLAKPSLDLRSEFADALGRADVAETGGKNRSFR